LSVVERFILTVVEGVTERNPNLNRNRDD